jgi:hypothetical protein
MPPGYPDQPLQMVFPGGVNCQGEAPGSRLDGLCVADVTYRSHAVGLAVLHIPAAGLRRYT